MNDGLTYQFNKFIQWESLLGLGQKSALVSESHFRAIGNAGKINRRSLVAE